MHTGLVSDCVRYVFKLTYIYTFFLTSADIVTMATRIWLVRGLRIKNNHTRWSLKNRVSISTTWLILWWPFSRIFKNMFARRKNVFIILDSKETVQKTNLSVFSININSNIWLKMSFWRDILQIIWLSNRLTNVAYSVTSYFSKYAIKIKYFVVTVLVLVGSHFDNIWVFV